MGEKDGLHKEFKVKTAKREAFEETGLRITDLELFGIYSGEKCFVDYPNGDKVYSVQIIFKAKQYTGELGRSDLTNISLFPKTEQKALKYL
ncbi:NUDIX domain-containing protein [Neobacillus drentensis]|uniref:NUDIX domain-containing protein n=1 Tax=Neobacillus drentensis TaxID=220684 RepID=UPI002FFF82E5